MAPKYHDQSHKLIVSPGLLSFFKVCMSNSLDSNFTSRHSECYLAQRVGALCVFARARWLACSGDGHVQIRKFKDESLSKSV